MTILRRHGSNVYVPPTPPDVLHGIYPDENRQMQGVLVGQGELSVARAADIWLPDYNGQHNQFLGGDIGYRGGRADLDPAKLFATFTVTAATPAELANCSATFNDGSTHREKYSSGDDYLLSESFASGVDNKYRPLDGWAIDVYLGNAAALTNFYCNTNNLTGSIPDLSANTSLTNFYCSNNNLTGSIPDLSANTSLTNFYCSNNNLTGQIPDLSANTSLIRFYCYGNNLTGSIPDLSTNTSLTYFYCSINNLTGSIPDLSANTSLIQFWCYVNNLTGQIPDLSANTSLTEFWCYDNNLTGQIPDLSTNTSLTDFYCYDNNLTGFNGGWPNKAVDFNASNNALTEAAVNQILIDADTYGIPVGTTITLTGGTNAAPTGAGITAKNNLIANGANVSTN